MAFRLYFKGKGDPAQHAMLTMHDNTSELLNCGKADTWGKRSLPCGTKTFCRHSA